MKRTYLPPPLCLRLGVIKRNVTPERNQEEIERGESAYRGTGSTANSVAQDSTNCKKNKSKTGYVAGDGDVPRFYMNFGSFGERSFTQRAQKIPRMSGRGR